MKMKLKTVRCPKEAFKPSDEARKRQCLKKTKFSSLLKQETFE